MEWEEGRLGGVNREAGRTFRLLSAKQKVLNPNIVMTKCGAKSLKLSSGTSLAAQMYMKVQGVAVTREHGFV